MFDRIFSGRNFQKLVAAIVAASFILTACGTQATEPAPAATDAPAPTEAPVPDTKSPVNVTWMNWGGVERFEPSMNAFSNCFPETKERFTVEVVSGGDSDVPVNEKIRLAAAAGGEGMPDMVTMNYSSFPEFASKGLLTDLTDMLPQSVIDDMLPAAREMVSYNGRIVAIPMQLNGKIWYYRKDLFEGAGIDPNSIKTFEDFMEAAKKLNEKYPDTYIINLGPQPIHYLYDEILSNWSDVKFADESGKYFITENPHFRTLLEWMKTWYDSKYVFKADDWGQDWQPAIADDKIASFLISTWMSEFIPSFAPDQKDKWGATLWPEFNRNGSSSGGGLIAIPKGAINPELALEFLTKRFLDPSCSAKIFEVLPLAPVTISGIEEVRSWIRNYQRPADMSDADWAVAPINYYGPDFMEPAFKSMDVFRVPPFDPSYQAELAILRQHTEAVLAGKETIDQALSGAQKDMETQIGNPYQK